MYSEAVSPEDIPQICLVVSGCNQVALLVLDYHANSVQLDCSESHFQNSIPFHKLL